MKITNPQLPPPVKRIEMITYPALLRVYLGSAFLEPKDKIKLKLIEKYWINCSDRLKKESKEIQKLGYIKFEQYLEEVTSATPIFFKLIKRDDLWK